MGRTEGGVSLRSQHAVQIAGGLFILIVMVFLVVLLTSAIGQAVGEVVREFPYAGFVLSFLGMAGALAFYRTFANDLLTRYPTSHPWLIRLVCMLILWVGLAFWAAVVWDVLGVRLF